MLRAIPLGKRYLSEAEQARAVETAKPPTLADRESMVHAAKQRMGAELDRREEQIRMRAGSDRPIEDAIEALLERGAISGAGSFTERAQLIEEAEGNLEDDLVALKEEEAAILKEPGGEELLRAARLQVLDDDRAAKTLAEGEEIVDKAVALQVAAAQQAKQQGRADRAAVAQQQRISRTEQVLSVPEAAETFIAALDAQNRSWRRTSASPADIDQALDAAEGNRGRSRLPSRQHRLVLRSGTRVPRCPQHGVPGCG